MQKEGNGIVICGNKQDVKGKITSMTTELVKRTEELNKTLIASVQKT